MVVVLIVGIVSKIGVDTYEIYQISIKRERAEEKIEMIKNAIAKFASVYKRLPCPAAINMSTNSDEFGKEAISGTTCANGYGAYGLISGDSASPPFDTQSTTTPVASISVGIPPVRTLGLPDRFVFNDINNTRFTYAMDINLYNGISSAAVGSIIIKGVTPTTNTLFNKHTDMAFVLIGHNPDYGGWEKSGRQQILSGVTNDHKKANGIIYPAGASTVPYFIDSTKLTNFNDIITYMPSYMLMS